jgi:hypothetical protein
VTLTRSLFYNEYAQLSLQADFMSSQTWFHFFSLSGGIPKFLLPLDDRRVSLIVELSRKVPPEFSFPFFAASQAALKFNRCYRPAWVAFMLVPQTTQQSAFLSLLHRPASKRGLRWTFLSLPSAVHLVLETKTMSETVDKVLPPKRLSSSRCV